MRALLSNAGGIDPGFGNGQGTYVPLSGIENIASDVAVQPDGKIIAVGYPDANSHLVIVRFNPDGTLDTSFAGDGELVTTVGKFSGPSYVAVAPDGSIVVAGEGFEDGPTYLFPDSVIVERFLPDGTPDDSFGSAGVAQFPIGTNDPFPNLGALAVQPDGKVIVGGYTVSQKFEGMGVFPVVTESAAAARLDADGSLDTSFGDGGTESVPIQLDGNSLVTIDAIALQPDGKVVLGGSAVSGDNVVTDFPAGSYTEGLVVRLDADGTPDATFGGPSAGGVVTIPPDLADPSTQGFGLVVGLALQPDGKIVLEDGSNSIDGTFSVDRLDADGTIDATFGRGGEATIPGAAILPESLGGIAVQPDGAIVAALSVEVAGTYDGHAHQGALVVRFNPDGTPDSTFGNPADPGATMIYLDDSTTFVSALALEPDGNIILAGSLDTEGNYIGQNSAFALVQLLGQSGAGSTDPAPVGEDPGLPTNPGTGTPPTPITEPVPVGTPIDVPVIVEGPVATVPIEFTPASPLAEAPADYDGSGKSDVSVYLAASGSFAIRPAAGGPDESVPFGIKGPGQTIPAPGDYTGAGRTEIAAYIPSQGVYAYRPASGPDVVVPFGIPGAGQSIPAPGDFEGTNKDDIAVYLPSLGAFGIRPSTGGPDEIVPFGIKGAGQSIPAVGHYSSTTRDDIAVYLPSLGVFGIRPAAGGPDEIIPFGIPGAGKSIPIPGDYDGSGYTELAVYMPSLGEFAYRPHDGGPDVIEAFGAVGDGSIPVPGDYDGSGRTEIAVYDPNSAYFAYRPAKGGPDVIRAFGTAGPANSLPPAAPAVMLVPASPPAPTSTTEAGLVARGSFTSTIRQRPRASVLVTGHDPSKPHR